MHKHTKPHFKYSGGVYEVVYTDDDPYEYVKGIKTTVIMMFTEAGMDDLIGAYRWWKKRDPKMARITFAMMMRRTALYRVSNPRGRRKWVVNDNRILANIRSRYIKAYLQSEVDKARKKTAKLKPAKHYIDMIASGYCRVSNNHRTVSRIDTPDWKLEQAIHLKPWDPDTVELRERSGDYYRRCISKDKIRYLEPEIYKLFPASAEGPDHYLPLMGDINYGQ